MAASGRVGEAWAGLLDHRRTAGKEGLQHVRADSSFGIAFQPGGRVAYHLRPRRSCVWKLNLDSFNWKCSPTGAGWYQFNIPNYPVFDWEGEPLRQRKRRLPGGERQNAGSFPGRRGRIWHAG